MTSRSGLHIEELQWHIMCSLKYPKYASYIEGIAHCAWLDRGQPEPMLGGLSLTVACDAALNASFCELEEACLMGRVLRLTA